MDKFKILWATTLFPGILSIPLHQTRLHSDVGLNIFELARKYGYPIERHHIETEDGYLLEMHRIPHGLHNSTISSKPPVLVVHGILGSSVDFLTLGPNRALAYLLADEGYDVWLPNVRGTVWSRSHKVLSPHKKSYWNFSFHEIGQYDLPALIDYVLAVTEHENIYYIGWSQGVTVVFVMLSERPEYNDKIKMMHALAPSAYLSHKRSPLRIFAYFGGTLENIQNILRIYKYDPPQELVQQLGKVFCNENVPTKRICEDLFFINTGFDREQLENDILPVILTNFPVGVSRRQFTHYGQVFRSGIFRQYDYYSKKNNMRIYGQPTPPHYNLSKVITPVCLYYGRNDWVISIEDLEILSKQLPNVFLKYEIDYDKFNHMDFMWAKDANVLVYKKIISILKTT